MTPFDIVLEHFRFPSYIVPHPIQVDVINDLAPLNAGGYWLDMGTGKTFCSTVVALYHRILYGHSIVVIMPPLLVKQWSTWLGSIQPALSITEYNGTPKQRVAKSLDSDFVLVGSQIFKKDYARIDAHFQSKRYTVIIDEAAMVSNNQSDTHKKIYWFCVLQSKLLLTGTPANNPLDLYGLLTFTAPGTYKHKTDFERRHVKYWTSYGKPTEYIDLDVLATNLLINSKRVLFDEMYSETQEPLYSLINYELEATHYKLYVRLAEEALIKLPESGEVDFLTAQRLIHALGQIIVNLNHFNGHTATCSNAIEIVRGKLEELGSGKLVVFANYKKSVEALINACSNYGALPINSEVSTAQKVNSIERFKTDASCRLLVVQYKSGGYGLDGLQHACNHCLFIEPCQQPRDFHQAVARLKRIGQSKRVLVYLAVASKTLQVRGFKNLLHNDGVLNKVIRNSVDLRAAIFDN